MPKKKATKKTARRGANQAVNEVAYYVKDLIGIRKEDSDNPARWDLKVTKTASTVKVTNKRGKSLYFDFGQSSMSVTDDDSLLQSIPYSSLYHVQDYGIEAFTDKSIASQMVNEELKDTIFSALYGFTGEPRNLGGGRGRGGKQWWQFWK